MTTVLDLDPAKCQQFAPLRVSASPAEVADTTDVVFTALPMPPHVKAVFEGEAGLLAGLGPDKVWIDHSTTDHEQNKVNK